jgi:hypothetical protein
MVKQKDLITVAFVLSIAGFFINITFSGLSVIPLVIAGILGFIMLRRK